MVTGVDPVEVRVIVCVLEEFTDTVPKLTLAALRDTCRSRTPLPFAESVPTVLEVESTIMICTE
jgi:hypothetical protein